MGRARKFPDFLSQWPKSHKLFELPLFKYLPKYSHISTPSLQGLITNLPRSPRLSYNYDTNMTQISYMNYSARGNAGLPSIGLEKIYCYVPCKCAFLLNFCENCWFFKPIFYRFISFPEFKSIFPPSDTRNSIIWILPSRVQRAPIIRNHQSNSAEKPMKM